MSDICSDELNWWVYLIRNRYDALYCGITNDLEKRVRHHQEGKGAKALKGKGPLQLVWCQPVEDKSTALKLEYQIKNLPKRQKEQMVANQGKYKLS